MMKTPTEFTVKGIENYLYHVLGDDPIENRSLNYLKALEGIGIEGVRKLILSLLANGIQPEMISSSYFHPNKFFKLGICRLSNKVKLRIHFWNKNQLEATTPIHFHAWDFASLLITGSYLHDTFDVMDLNQNELKMVQIYKESQKIASSFIPEEYFGLYKIPKRDPSLGKFRPEFVKYVHANKRTSKIELEGSAYFLDMQYPHQITIDLKNVGSMITLVITSETHPERVFTFQPLTQTETFDNPSPGVDESTVRLQLELILSEINKVKARQFDESYISC